jgi:hypothetical protein
MVTFDSAGINLGIEHSIKSIVASVASNALTVGLAATTLDFRSSTLSIGATTRLATPNLTMTIPTGATLGTINATQSRIVLLAINNAGTVELAVVNIAGGTNLDESGLISTTALTAGSTSASVVYSLVARTNVPFRVVGAIDSTQTTAGTWATAPTTVQGCGGQALTAMSSMGYGQTWQNLTGSRTAGTTYTNTSSKPIMFSAVCNSNPYYVMSAAVNGVTIWTGNSGGAGYSQAATVVLIVPPGSTYRVDISVGSLGSWYELR